MDCQELLHSPIIPPQIAALVVRAAKNNVPILIQGEKGSGKRLLAKIIHHAGDWKRYVFYGIDCKTSTEHPLIEQFSHLLKEIHYGTTPATIYLKEVGFLEQTDQLRLLEVLEEGVFQDSAGTRTIQNLRFISSSREDLKEKVLQGKFSEDLYDQLATQSILIPPLRKRVNEIPSVAQFLLAKHSKKNGIKTKEIGNDALLLLQRYWWPGNLRELEQVIVRSAIRSEGETLREKDLCFETESANNSFGSYHYGTTPKSPVPQAKHSSEEQNAYALSLFFIEFIHRIKNPLVSIKTFTQLLREKFTDMEFRDYFYKIVSEDIEKIDSVLNGLLNYIKVNTPMEKTDTIHSVIEDILKRNMEELEKRKIKIFKKFERNLPETTVHEEQLRYILSSLVQYAIPSVPPNGSIGFLTKLSDGEKGKSEDQTSIQKDGRCIEVMIAFNGYKRQADPFEMVLGVRDIHVGETMELELRLIQEVIQKNRGTMKFEASQKRARTVISLKFPIERRKLIYYQPAGA